MDGVMKNKLKRFATETEVGAVRSILKWKYEKTGRRVPSSAALEKQSRKAVFLANDIISTTGKTVWNDLKQVYGKKCSGSGGVKKKGTGE
jgi:hypothetical protein